MSYHISETKVTGFISNSSIRLPRFQRRKAWSKNQEFELCVSMFKGYPLGVVIYNHTKERGRDVNYLLDGRQRREALKKIIDDPAKLYEDAISYLHLSPKSTEQELRDAFWEKVGVFLNRDDKPPLTHDDALQDLNDQVDSDINCEVQASNLKILVELLCLLHGSLKKNVTALEQRWDFSSYCRPRYIRKNGNVDIKILKDFILRDLIAFADKETFSSDELYDSLESACYIDDAKADEFKDKLYHNIDLLIKDFKVLRQAQTLVFEQADIGVIEIENVSSIDSQKIFSLVNKGGTQLKPEELLSAKPFWNRAIPGTQLSVDIRNSIAELYRELQIPGDSDPHTGTFVYWDLCATYIDQIDKFHLLFPKCPATESGLLTKIQLGFKMVAALLEDGVSALKIESIEKDESIDYVNDVVKSQSTVNAMLQVLLEHAFFTRLLKWQQPLSSLIGLIPTWEFVAILVKLWRKLGCQTGDNRKKFVHCAISLVDKLVFEHATGQWKGSGHTTLAKHLSDIESRTRFLDDKDWTNFIVKACAATDEDYRKHKGVLYYLATLQGKEPTNPTVTEYDIDHIIPQEDFNQIVSGSSVDLKLMNCLGNVSLLPRKKNQVKSKKHLNELGDDMRQLVSMYSDVDINDFEKYSSVSHVSELVECRKRVFLDVLKNRQEVIVN